MDAYFRNRIETITDSDFRSSVAKRSALLSKRSSLKTDNDGDVYTTLASIHSASLGEQAREYKKGIAKAYSVGTARKKLRKAAYKVVDGRFIAWDAQEVRFGETFDFSVDLGLSGTCGFHYMRWTRPVLDYYALCGDPVCAGTLNSVVSQYYDQRKRVPARSFHPVYYELGCWAKTHMLLPVYMVLLAEDALDRGNIKRLLKLFMGFGRSLFRIQQKGFRPGNWQLVGCEALFRLAVSFPEFKESIAWRKCAEKILVRHARDGFYPDGCHKERSWNYGWMSLSAMADFYVTAKQFGCLGKRAERSIRDCLKRGFKWFAASTSPDGHMLNYGDGGLPHAGAVLKRAITIFPGLGRAEEFLGVDRSRSSIMRDSGYAFMRCDADKDAPFMSVNFGRYFNSHSHDDLLDFSLWCFGEPLIDEVGGFGSYDSPLRPFFCSDIAHNQPVIEHVHMNRQEHEGHDVLWSTSDRADLFSAWHEAYVCSGQPIRIYRQIVFVKPLFWIVHDTIRGSRGFQAANYIHSPRPFRLCGNGMVRVSGKTGCIVKFADASRIRTMETAVDYSRREYTGNNPLEQERHRLVVRSWNETGNTDPVTFAMLLVPFKGRGLPRIMFRPIQCSGAYAFRVNSGAGEHIVVFNPERSDWRLGRRASDNVIALRHGRTWQCLSGRGQGLSHRKP